METTPPLVAGSPPSEGGGGEKELLGMDSRPITAPATSTPIEVGSAAELRVSSGARCDEPLSVIGFMG